MNNDAGTMGVPSTTTTTTLRMLLFKTNKEFQNLKKERFGTKARNAAINATVGDILIPLVGNLERRNSLAQRGIYAGVEYIVKSLSIMEEDDDSRRQEYGKNRTSLQDITTNLDTSTERADPKTQQTAPSVIAYIQPAYKLRENLERTDWPVRVDLFQDGISVWISKSTYLAGNALGTLLLSLTVVVAAAISSFFVQFVIVPSPSMVPAVHPGTVVLVTRSIQVPLLANTLLYPKPRVGDVVFFEAPSELETAVQNFVLVQQQREKDGGVSAASSLVVSSGNDDNNNENTNNDPIVVDTLDDDIIAATVTTSTTQTQTSKGKRLLKRVVAVPGEMIGVKQSEPYVMLNNKETNPDNNRAYRFAIIGPYIRPELFPATSWNRAPQVLQQNEYFVAGDNGYRSFDSRIWGPLQQQYIVGTAKWIVWPISNFGPVPSNPQMIEVTKPTMSSIPTPLPITTSTATIE